MRVVGIIGAAAIVFAALLHVSRLNLDMHFENETERVMLIGFIAIILLFTFLDTFSTAVNAALVDKGLGGAITAALKKFHRVIFAYLIMITTYFLIWLILFVIFGTVVWNFSVVEIAAMVYGLGFFIFAIILIIIGVVASLLANNFFLLFNPLLIDDSLIFLNCIDVAFKAAFTRKRLLTLSIFNIIGKVSLLIFYVSFFFFINRLFYLPWLLRTGYSDVDNAIAIIICLLITYLIGSLIVPLCKSVTCSLRPLAVKPMLTESKQNGTGGRLASVAIDITVQAAALTVLFFAFVRLFGGNDINWSTITSIGVFPVVVVLLIIAVVATAFNLMIKRFFNGKFVGKHLISINFDKKPNKLTN